MRMKIRTRTGFIETEGSPRDVLRLLWRLRGLILAGSGEARRMSDAIRHEARKRGLLR